MKTIDLIIPTYKPDDTFAELLKRIKKQTIQPNRIIVINTEESYYDTSKFETLPNMTLIHITKEEFDHGGTRNYGVSLSEADYVMLMTQDAMPANKYLIEEMLKGFSDDTIGAVYGRQLPRKHAGTVEAYTRSFNYPKESQIKRKEDIERLGIKAFFCSNVCAAYRRDLYEQLGGFVTKTIFNEDMIFAYHVLQADYAIHYAADAMVIHSHGYAYIDQFRRNFDLAVSQKQYNEIFGQVKSESEGIKYVKTTIKYLNEKKKYLSIIDFIMESGFKFLGYKLGHMYNRLPDSMVRWCSMNKSYWTKKEQEDRRKQDE